MTEADIILKMQDLTSKYALKIADNEARRKYWVDNYLVIADYIKTIGNVLNTFNYFNNSIYTRVDEGDNITHDSSIIFWVGNTPVLDFIEKGFQIQFRPTFNGFIKCIAYGYTYDENVEQLPLFESELYEPTDLNKLATYDLFYKAYEKITNETSLHFAKI